MAINTGQRKGVRTRTKSSTTVERKRERDRAKLSTTVNAGLLKQINQFAETHADVNRGEITDEAFRLFLAREREREIAAQYEGPMSPEEQEEYEGWRSIRRASATRMFERVDAAR